MSSGFVRGQASPKIGEVRLKAIIQNTYNQIRLSGRVPMIEAVRILS